MTAETALVWAKLAVPAVDGVPLELDLGRHAVAVAERMPATNQDGRDLCRRFLRVAQDARCVDPPDSAAPASGRVAPPESC